MCFFRIDFANHTLLSLELHLVYLVSARDHVWLEWGHEELATWPNLTRDFVDGSLWQFLDDIGDPLAVGGIELAIELVEDVEGREVNLLNCKYQTGRHHRFLSPW